jgi:hypothetical protein
MCISTLRILANPISNTPLPCVFIQSESNFKGSFGNIFSINQSGRPGRLRTYKVVITDPKSTLNGLEGLIPWSTSRSSACTKTTKMPCENHVFLTGWRRVSYATRCIVQGRALPLSAGLRPIEAVHTVLKGTCRLSTHRIPTLVDFITFFWLGPFLQPVALYGLLQLRISQSLQQYAGLHSF